MKRAYGGAAKPLDTPYADAHAKWDTKIGAPTVSAYHWRLFAFALVIVLTLTIGGLIYRGGEVKVVPVYIAIDSLGEAHVLADMQTTAKPSDASIKFHLRQFVINVWRVSSDAALTKQGWIDAFHFASKRGHQQLHAELDPWLDRPAELALKGTASVVAEQPLKITGESWQVDWVRTPKDVNGQPGKPKKFRGTFRVITAPPKTVQEVINNPLGVYVDEFNRIEL